MSGVQQSAERSGEYSTRSGADTSTAESQSVCPACGANTLYYNPQCVPGDRYGPTGGMACEVCSWNERQHEW